MNEGLVLNRREYNQAIDAAMAAAFPHEADAYHDRVGRRGGMRALSTLMLAGVLASGAGLAANDGGESTGPGYYGYDNIELPTDLPLIAEVQRTSVDASIATVSAAAEVRPALADVKECKPNVNNVIFYAEQTPDSSDGPAITGNTVEEVKAEAYDRFAHDPLLVAKKRHSLKLANHTEKTLVEKTKQYMTDPVLWQKECQELINSIEGAKSVTIETRSGTYLTEYTGDDLNKDGVPDPAMGYEKTVNANMRVLVVVLADGTVAELKLDCGLQDMQFHKEVRRKVEEKKKEDAAPTSSSTTPTTKPPTTSSSTTSTTAPPTTTSSTTSTTRPPTTTTSTTTPTTTSSTTTSTTAPSTTTSSTSSTTSTTAPQAPKVLYCVGPNGVVQVGDVNNDGDIDQLDIDQTPACNELPNNGPGSGGNEGPVGTTSTTAETTSTTQQTNTSVVTPTTVSRPTTTVPPVNVPTSVSSTVPAGPGPNPNTVFIP